LCGGGITGAMYEVGALLAVDDYLGAAGSASTSYMGPASTQFDIYVGISAGAFVATALCGGISPERLARAVLPDPVERYLVPQLRREVFRFEPLRAAGHGLRLGATLLRSALRVARGTLSPREIAGELAAATPAGFFSMRQYKRFLERFLRQYRLPRKLSAMPRELYIPANDLDSGRRVVFGDRGGYFGQGNTLDLSGVGTAEAICASSAIPVIFEPVRVRGRDYIDGGTGKADHIDVALKRGAKLVLAINPMVPISHNPRAGSGLLGKSDRLREHGLFTVYDQTMRMAIKARLHQGLRRWQAEYPDADILLLEPDERDADMFLQNPMNFEAREQILSYGYKSAAHQLRTRRPLFEAMCQRHGLRGDLSRLKLVWP
jgi:predicted acylesterase/phospholipase RssA